MSGLLKSDFYKLSKMKSFPICLLIVVALTVGSVFIQDYSAQFLGEGIVYNGSNQLLSTFAGDCKIFIAIVVSIFAASEFGFGTIKNTASRGFSRISIYFSKLVVSCFIALMIQLVYSIAYTGTATILWGFGEVSASYWPETLKIVGLEFLLTFAYTAVFVMVAMLIRQSGGAIAINLCITMQFIYLFVSLAQMALFQSGSSSFRLSSLHQRSLFGKWSGHQRIDDPLPGCWDHLFYSLYRAGTLVFPEARHQII